MHLLDPNVDPWANRHHLAEEFNNEDNTSTLLRTVFSYIDADDHAYFGQVEKKSQV